jgi:hypothetical protein
MTVDFNRSTQLSISFFLLGFESQGLAHTASDPKVPGFFECCVDRLNRQPKADISIVPASQPKKFHVQKKWLAVGW